MTKMTAPYGSWESPIKAELLAKAGISLSSPYPVGEDLYWLEGRPLEGGRNVLVRRAADGTTRDVTPAGFNVRTTVHEYGGGSFTVTGSTVYFSNFADQRLYRQIDGGAPEPITPEPAAQWGERYADMQVTPDGRSIIAVREVHGAQGNVDNDLVIFPADGSGIPVSLTAGYDFYASPRVSPDGKKLAWVSWNHPSMPWDDTELWLADLMPDGSLGTPRLIAGGPDESVCYPVWGPAGELVFASDRSNWWNLYRYQDGQVKRLVEIDAEMAGPAWVFGLSPYTFLPDGRIVCTINEDGFQKLALLDQNSGELDFQPLEYNLLDFIRYSNGLVFMMAGNASTPMSVISFDPASKAVRVYKSAMQVTIDSAYFSTPQAITYPTENGLEAHALYYPPRNPDFSAPEGTKPPLIVFSHGGPTGQTRANFSYSMQFWTSRGIAVVDVNYGGSTGYGREYRERLQGNWGIVDIQDCVNAAKYLINQGLADPEKVAIRGGSAGGYSTLRALTWTDFFKAGASYFGVSDLEGLARDTHKFESRYLDGLIGKYPEEIAIYKDRSPVYAVDNIKCPVILFQGLEDRVVPPSQAEVIVHALIRNETPYSYITYEGEQHGFRKAETIINAAESELDFYGQVFGFKPADEIAKPVKLENM